MQTKQQNMECEKIFVNHISDRGLCRFPTVNNILNQPQQKLLRVQSRPGTEDWETKIHTHAHTQAQIYTCAYMCVHTHRHTQIHTQR